jgi:hypothetical protein
MKRKITKLSVILLLLILISIITSRIDYSRLSNGNKPLFSLAIAHFKDGGTVAFIGFGYQLISWHQIAINDQIKKGYLVGTELFYFPLFKYWPLITYDFDPDIKLKFIQEN